MQDVTELVEEEAELQKEQLILKEQELSNLLHQKDYVRAVGVAISLGQPFRVLNILQGQHSQVCIGLYNNIMYCCVTISFK